MCKCSTWRQAITFLWSELWCPIWQQHQVCHSAQLKIKSSSKPPGYKLYELWCCMKRTFSIVLVQSHHSYITICLCLVFIFHICQFLIYHQLLSFPDSVSSCTRVPQLRLCVSVRSEPEHARVCVSHCSVISGFLVFSSWRLHSFLVFLNFLLLSFLLLF